MMMFDGKRGWRRLAYFVFSLAVTVGVFSYLLSHVSMSEVLNLIRGVDRRGLAMFLVLSLSMSVFRVWRYQLVLGLAGLRPSPVALYLVVLVRNFFSDLLPARLGSLIYVYMATSRLGLPFSSSLSSYTLSFLFDIVALGPLIVLAALQLGADTGLSSAWLTGGGLALVGITVLMIFLFPRLLGLGCRLLGRARFLGTSRVERWCGMLTETAREIEEARRAGVYLRLLGLSVLVRLTKYGALYVFLFALLAPLGYGFEQLRFSRVFVGLCASEFAASLPVSGLAGFGAYEGTWAVVFELLGYPARIARLTSVSHHLFTQVYGYSLGVAALLVLLLPTFRCRDARVAQNTKLAPAWLFWSQLAGLTLVIGLCLAACLLV